MKHQVVELRQYTLHPGRRDELIDLFDREFVETQEETGTAVLGQFRDLDDPDRFVWLRSFPDMPARAGSLGAFYGGPVWKEHRDAANATMIDSDDVLLLRPVPGRPGFPPDAKPRNGLPPTTEPGGPAIVATLAFGEDASFYEDRRDALLAAAGPEAFGLLQTEYADNTFPALPVRTGEHVLMWFTRSPAPLPHIDGVRTHQLRLSPTSRSRIR